VASAAAKRNFRRLIILGRLVAGVAICTASDMGSIASVQWSRYVKPVPGLAAKIKASPLCLLLRLNALHSWRRLLAIREQSRLLTVIIGFFVVGYLVLAFEMFYYGMKFVAKFPGLGAVL